MYDKKKLTILRAVLIVLGAAVGGTAMWQYFVFYPVIRRELQIVVIVVSSAALSAALALSAKPFYRLGASVCEQFSKLVCSLGAKGVVAVVSGLCTAVMIGFLFDFIISNAVSIIAVRVLADAIVSSLVAALCCYGFTKWISTEEDSEPEVPHRRGYLLTASCFFDDRVFTAADFLIDCKVSGLVFTALWKFGDVKALERLKAVSESGKVDVIKNFGTFETENEYTQAEAQFAAVKRLVPVCSGQSDLAKIEGARSLDAFTQPKDEMLSDFAIGKDGRLSDGAVNLSSDAENENSDNTVNGQIIIDK